MADATMKKDSKRKQLKIRGGDLQGAITYLEAKAADEEFFSSAPRGIAFSDSFVRISDRGLEREKLDTGHRQRFAYAFPWTEEEPEDFISFLCDMYSGDADAWDRIRFDREFFGACIAGIAPRFLRVLLKFDKYGGSGKGTLASIVEDCMPPGTVCHSNPSDWGGRGDQGAYSRAPLAGKRLNIVSELPGADLENLEAFKAIVSGDSIDAREPGTKRFTFKPEAGHYFSANGVPVTRDLSQAFFDRVCVMRLNRKSIRGTDAQDTRKADKVKREINRIVPWLLRGAAQLELRGKYILPASHQAEVDVWAMASDQVRQFAVECLNRGGETMGSKLYESYTRWAQANGVGRMSNYKFAGRLDMLGFESRHTKMGTTWAASIRPESDGR